MLYRLSMGYNGKYMASKANEMHLLVKLCLAEAFVLGFNLVISNSRSKSFGGVTN
jgi:hypothetical protein